MQRIRRLLNPEWWRFEWRYWRRQTPWDTQITPPEVMKLIRQTPPGRALDLGCGTGTNAVTLTEHGWRATGVDFSDKAITAARRKASRRGLEIDFFVGDVSDLGFLKEPYDYILDIGCLFTLSAEQQERYAGQVARLLVPGAVFMLYAWLPHQRKGHQWGISPSRVHGLFRKNLVLTDVEAGKDGPGDSAWYWFERK